VTAPLWLPGITYLKSTNNGGSMTGSDNYFTWHTYECGYDVSATAGARGLITQGTEVHFCFNPVTGELVQILPADVAGRGLVNLSGGVQTNRQGRVNLQVEVIGRASRPWTQDVTAAGRKGVAKLVDFADQWGVPRTHPNGDQGPFDKYAPTNRSVTGWNGPGGYFCHAQVPENDHWDHGAVKFTDLWTIADTINHPQEDDMAQADIDAINGYTGKLLVAGYTVGGEPHTGIGPLVEALAKKVDDLSAKVDVLPSGGIDYAALAKAVNDDAAKRLQA
jgi:hypothetical protein